MSTQMTSCPESAKQVPVTRPRNPYRRPRFLCRQSSFPHGWPKEFTLTRGSGGFKALDSASDWPDSTMHGRGGRDTAVCIEQGRQRPVSAYPRHVDHADLVKYRKKKSVTLASYDQIGIGRYLYLTSFIRSLHTSVTCVPLFPNFRQDCDTECRRPTRRIRIRSSHSVDDRW